MFVGLRYEGERSSPREEFDGDGLPVIGLKPAPRSISGLARCAPGRVVDVVAVDCDSELPGLLGFKNVDSGASSSDSESLDDSDVSESERVCRGFAIPDAATISRGSNHHEHHHRLMRRASQKVLTLRFCSSDDVRALGGSFGRHFAGGETCLLSPVQAK